MSNRPVLIAGAGIAGLAVALALARAGFPSIILERRETASESGAGIQLGPNATRLLADLGVAEFLKPLAVAPGVLKIGRGLSGKPLAELPLSSLEAKFGSPYWTIARADLHAVLRDRAFARGMVDLRTGFTVESAVSTEIGAIAVEASGEQVSGMALIGCDGLWSNVRKSIATGAAPRFAGKSAWRATIPATGDDAAVGLWLAPEAHVVHYPIAAGRFTNLVAIFEDRDRTPAWDRQGDPEFIKARFADWADPVRALIHSAPAWQKWPLYELDPLASWCNGPVTLAGDAAHPVLPFLAQGAGLAIEDAVVIARALKANPSAPAKAFAIYQQARIARAAKLTKAARENGRTYHMDGFAAGARDLVLRQTPAKLLISRYDWLYGFQADEISFA